MYITIYAVLPHALCQSDINDTFLHYLSNGTLGTFVALLEADLSRLLYMVIYGGF